MPIVGKKMSCILCGREVLCRSSGQKYCPDCAKEVKRERSREYARRARERHCDLCGNLLTPAEKKLCRSCAAESGRKPRACRHCGKMIDHPSARQVYCSETCRNAKKTVHEEERPESRNANCTRANGKQCIWWMPICGSSAEGQKCCHYMYYTGHSTGQENPCKVRGSGARLNVQTDTKGLYVRSRYDDIDRYEAKNVYKRR